MADPYIHIVAIATPINTHFQLAKQALEQGKHVFVEKPLATSSQEAEELIYLARDTGRKLMVGHTFLYTSAVRKIKDIIDSGELGGIYYINAQRLNLGLFKKDYNVVWDLAPMICLLFCISWIKNRYLYSLSGPATSIRSSRMWLPWPWILGII